MNTNGNELVRQGKDSDRRREAFKLFCQIGNKAEVARRLKVSSAVVYGWARFDKWDEERQEIRSKVKIHLDFLKNASDNKIVQLLSADIALLEYLQQAVSEKIVTQAIEPKTWKDVIMTQKFIMESKERILGHLLTEPPSNGNPIATQKKEPLDELSGNFERYLGSAISPKNSGDGTD